MVYPELAGVTKINFADTWAIPQEEMHALSRKPRGILDLNLSKIEQARKMPNEKVGWDSLDIGST